MKKTLLITVYFLTYMCCGQAQILFGTTSLGGEAGGGTLNRFIPATKNLTVVKSFESVARHPDYSSFVQAGDGKLYGTTSFGGQYNAGVIFSYDPATAAYTRLKDFNITDGSHPYGTLMQAGNGKLYGLTAEGGGNSEGVIFSFDPLTFAYTKLRDFNEADGRTPYGNLLQAGNGKLYGTTKFGGSHYAGVIFSFDPATLVYTKLKDLDGASGANPNGILVQAGNGKLYGTTENGGSAGDGVIFSFDPSTSIYTKVKEFERFNGYYPNGGLVQAGNGKLYGLTSRGGSAGGGVIFSFDP